ncbi:outer membrane protein assembly factor BamD [Hymenobacter sp. B1770]|uniref:outer membrane protein assembly factor BamD n=1 Tax=Hymenobacter sp. B1770 TaxID=1718788 RepID=UPI003CEA8CAB
MPISRLTVLFLLVSTLVLGSCASSYQRLLKNPDVNKKYEAAIAYYEKGDYFRAGTLLEDLIPLLKGRPEAEKAQFYFANTNYKQRNYVLSAFYFKQFNDTYPTSAYAEESAFLNAKSLFLDSPGFELDQTNTVSALESIQDFLNRYPESKFKPETENMSQELQKKLENKAFESARLYYQLRYNQAAVVALTNFQQDYPASGFAEQAAFLRLTAQFAWAQESIESKQRERFSEAVSFYQQFLDAYPRSKNLKAAQEMYDVSQAQIVKLKAMPASASN